MFHELQIAQHADAANSRIIGETVAKRLIFRSPTNGAACNILTPLPMLVSHVSSLGQLTFASSE